MRRQIIVCNGVNANHRIVGAILAIARDAMHWLHCLQRGANRIRPDALNNVASM
jgi:hypothetical protein